MDRVAVTSSVARHPLLVYAKASVAVAAAAIVRFWLNPVLGNDLPFFTFYFALLYAAWRGGLWPGLYALVLGIAGGLLLFEEPHHAFSLDRVTTRFDVLRFFIVGTAVSFICGALHRNQRRSELRRDYLRVTLSSIGDGVIATDVQGRVTSLNTVAEKLTGWTQSEAIGRDLATIFHIVNETTRQKVDNPALRALSEGIIVGLANHTILISRDGTERAIDDSAAPIRQANGEIIGSVLVFRDVTHRQQIEVAQKARSGQLRHLAEVAIRINASTDVLSVLRVVTAEAGCLITSHCAITHHVVDQDWAKATTVTSLSDKFAEWRTRDAAPGCHGINDLVCKTNQPLRLTDAELKSHPSFECVDSRSASTPPLRGLLAVPLVGRGGQNLGLIKLSDKMEGDFTSDDEAILVQLSQMASVAIENARLVQNLLDADHKKDEFLAILAHELRNPLAPIRTAVHTLRLTERKSPLTDQALAMMERQLSQMVRLVDDLLDVSRISRDRLELRIQPVSLTAVVNSAVESSRPLIDQMQHHLTVTLPREELTVQADHTRLSQIILNLLNNAAKYSERGGRIALKVERSGNCVIISVRDSGIGIPPDKLQSIFELFSQVDRSLEKSQGGLGIGLSLVKRLVEMHGGTVRAQSEGAHRGAEFTVQLPIIVEATEPDVLDRHEPLPEKPSALRVLIVDDNRDSADSLAELLTLLGHETLTAYDGEAGIRAANQFQPQAILLDIGLPCINGYEVCRRVREQSWGKSILIVATTGWGQEQDRQRSREVGFDHHMVKPVDPEVLASCLTRPRTAEAQMC